MKFWKVYVATVDPSSSVYCQSLTLKVFSSVFVTVLGQALPKSCHIVEHVILPLYEHLYKFLCSA